MAQPATEASQMIASFALRLDDPSVVMTNDELDHIVAWCFTAAKNASGDDLPRVYSVKGTALGRQEKYEDSLREFEKAARLASHVAQYANNVASAYIGLKQYDKADPWLQKALDCPVKQERVEFVIAANLARLAFCQGQMEQASVRLDKAIQLAQPKSRSDWFILAALAAELARGNDDVVELFARHLAATVDEDLGSTPAIDYVRKHMASSNPFGTSDGLARVVRAALDARDETSEDDPLAMPELSSTSLASIRELVSRAPTPPEPLRELFHGLGR